MISSLSSFQLLPGNFIAVATLLSLAGFIAWTIFDSIRAKKKYNYPNLVPGLPIIGNTHQLPPHDLCLHVEKLARKYNGDM